jgi:Ran-binding protein 1
MIFFSPLDANQFRDAFLKAQKDSAHLFSAGTAEDDEEDKEEEKTA